MGRKIIKLVSVISKLYISILLHLDREKIY